eukprot:6575463-Prymnesium_polylepis.1
MAYGLWCAVQAVIKRYTALRCLWYEIRVVERSNIGSRSRSYLMNSRSQPLVRWGVIGTAREPDKTSLRIECHGSRRCVCMRRVQCSCAVLGVLAWVGAPCAAPLNVAVLTCILE